METECARAEEAVMRAFFKMQCSTFNAQRSTPSIASKRPLIDLDNALLSTLLQTLVAAATKFERVTCGLS
jgi:hypothetical protein